MLLEPFKNARHPNFKLFSDCLELNAIRLHKFIEHFCLVENGFLDFLNINVFRAVFFVIVIVCKPFSLFFVYFKSFVSNLLDALHKFNPFDS